MWGDLPEGAQRVQQFLFEHGSAAVVRLLPETTATAQDAAIALGAPLSSIGKSIVFDSDTETIVAVACGDQRIDVAALALAAGIEGLSPMRAGAIRQATGYVIGGVSPFALPVGIRVIVDQRLRDLPECYVAAGHPRAIVQITPEELLALTGAAVHSIALGLIPGDR